MGTVLKAIDLMSGIRGRALGLEKAGLDVLYTLDSDGECKKICEQLLNYSKFIQGDTKKTLGESLSDVDIVSGKLMAQHSRMSGKEKNEVKNLENKATWEIIHKKMPKFFILEAPRMLLIRNRVSELKNIFLKQDFDMPGHYFVTV